MPGSIDPVPTGSMGGSGRFARSGIGGGASTVTDDVGVVEAGVDDVGVDDVGVAATAGVDDVGGVPSRAAMYLPFRFALSA